jgi:hypothetical protein
MEFAVVLAPLRLDRELIQSLNNSLTSQLQLLDEAVMLASGALLVAPSAGIRLNVSRDGESVHIRFDDPAWTRADYHWTIPVCSVSSP